MGDDELVPSRDARGRILPGHTGNPRGRLPRVVETKYLDLTMRKVSLSDWAEVVAMAILQAKDGNWKAREWLSQYLMPPPRKQVDVDIRDERAISDIDKEVTMLGTVLVEWLRRAKESGEGDGAMVIEGEVEEE